MTFWSALTTQFAERLVALPNAFASWHLNTGADLIEEGRYEKGMAWPTRKTP
jgi:hypothetical protein